MAQPSDRARQANAAPTGIAAAERLLGTLVDSVAAVLVVAEVVILFAGIVARYVLQAPLTWSDELASTLFLWLAMLGAVVALRRGEHMRMTSLVSRLNAPARAWFDALAIAAGLGFVVLVTAPAYRWFSEEAAITTPALEISAAWRAAAFPLGVGLMAVFSIFSLARSGWRNAVSAIACVVALSAAFWWLGPSLKPLGNSNLAIFFVGVVGIGVFCGVPIVFSFALATFGYLALTTRVPITTLVGRMDEGMSHLILLAVPLFIFSAC